MQTKTFKLLEYQPTHFEEAISTVSLPQDYRMLPLVHCASLEEREGQVTAGEILRSGRITPSMCDVFCENLVYTYVGRPAYRESRLPVCFVMKPLESLLQNIFVFDTGAYSNKRYSKLMDNFQDVDVYRIPADRESIGRFILKYFGGNENYFYSDPSEYSQDINEESLEEFSYDVFRHLRGFTGMGFDDRCRTLENIIRGEILLRDTLQCVIYPDSMCRMNEFLRNYPEIPRDTVILNYEDRDGGASPEECRQALNLILHRYYEKMGYFAAG